jgi:hypothetical protein
MTASIRIPAAVERYINRDIDTVNGWFTRTDARLLALVGGCQQANAIRGDICEIGVYQGRCLVLLSLLLRSDETAFGVDLFSQDIGDAEITRANLARFCNGTRSQLITKNSLDLEAADLQLNKPNATGIRLFCIDGGHTREIAARDYCFAETVLAQGGVVVVDDYFNRNWPGVAEGIHRVFWAGETRLKPFAIGQSKVLFTAGAFADIYRDAITRNWHPAVGEAELLDSSVAVVQRAPDMWQRIRTRPVVRAIRNSLRRHFYSSGPVALVAGHFGAEDTLANLLLRSTLLALP